MKKSKNHLSILLFLSLFFVLTNCEKDEDLNVNQNFKAQHTNFKVSHVGEPEIIQNKKLSEKLNTFVEIVDWINSPESNGGQASIITKKAIRVDKEKIEELLTGNETINQINCD